MPKESIMSFAEGFNGPPVQANKVAVNRAFDFDKAAGIIKQHLETHPKLVAEAGLQSDWNCTGGVIFEKGNPVNSEYTYLSSSWAIPTLIITSDGEEIVEVECFTDECERFNSGSTWDEQSLALLK